MSSITIQDGKLVLRDGKVGTGGGCCCGCCEIVAWETVYGDCRPFPDDPFHPLNYQTYEVDENCYAYYANGLTCFECGSEEGDECGIVARVQVTGQSPGTIEYLQSENGEPEVWSTTFPPARCDCPDMFVSITARCGDCREYGGVGSFCGGYVITGDDLFYLCCQENGDCTPNYFYQQSYCLPPGCSIEDFFNNVPGCEVNSGCFPADIADEYGLEPIECPEGLRCFTVWGCDFPA